MNTWQKPELTPICMNAEVGAYQEDFDGERPDGEVRGSHGGAASASRRTAGSAGLEPGSAISRSERSQ
jgi:hypothetical protein